MEGAMLDDDYTTSSSSYHELRLTIPDSLPVGNDRLASLQYHLDVTRFVIQRIVTLIVVIFGVVGNIFNILVLTRRWMKSSTNHYLTALAVYDTLYLLLGLTMTFSHYEAVRGATWYNRYRLPFGRPLTDVCSNTGVWLTLTFTVERYIGVCYPMKGKVWCTTRRAKYVILVVCLGAFVVTTPEFFEIEMVERRDGLNQTFIRPAKTSLGEQASYRLGYYYVNQILFTFLPLVLLLIFNSLLIRAVMYAARQRMTMTKTGDFVTTTTTPKTERHHRDQQRITVMLITVVVVFLICQLPQAVQKLYNEYLDHTDSMTPQRRTALMITANYFNLLVMINCSINFVLYSSFSTKFRMTFRRLFCRPRTPEVVLTEMTTGNQTQIDDCSSVGGAGNRRSSTTGSIASFSVTNPQQCRTRSPIRSPSQSPLGRGGGGGGGGGGGYTCDRLLRNRLSPSNMEMKTFKS